MQQIREQSYEQSSQHSLQVIHIESIQLHSSDQSLSPQNSSIISTKNKQIKKCLIKGLDFSITSSQFIQEEHDKKQIRKTKQYDHEILPITIAPKLGKQMNNQIDKNPIKADTFHIASFVQETQSITAMQNKSSNESLNQESEQKNQNMKKNSQQQSMIAVITSHSDNSLANASNFSFTRNYSRDNPNQTLIKNRTKSKRDNLNQTHASRRILSVPKNYRENKQNKNEQISSQSLQSLILLSNSCSFFVKDFIKLENPDQKQASRDKNQMKNLILVQKNKVIELIKQQEPEKLNFLLTIYKNESAINLRVQKDIFLPLEIQLDQIGSFKQEFYYSLNLSYKSFNIVELTSFRWKNLVKLILKTTSLCDDDWIVIVRQSNNFPSLNNFIQNVEQHELVQLKKGMPYLKEINFINNWIKAQNKWIKRFSYIQKINIHLLSHITISSSLSSQSGGLLIKPRNLSYLHHVSSSVQPNDFLGNSSNLYQIGSSYILKINLQNISTYSFKISNNILSQLSHEIQSCNKDKILQSDQPRILQEISLIQSYDLFSSNSQIGLTRSLFDKKDESFMMASFSDFLNSHCLTRILSIDDLVENEYEQLKDWLKNEENTSASQQFLEFIDDDQENNEGQVIIGKEKNSFPRYMIQQLKKIKTNGLSSSTLEMAANLNDIGSVLYRSGYVAQALKCFKKCHQVRLQMFDPYGSDVAIIQNSMGICYARLGNCYQAFKIYQKCKQTLLKNYEPGSIEVAIIKRNLSMILEKIGKCFLAIQQLKQSLSIKYAFFGAQSSQVAKTLDQIGNIYCKIDNYDLSLENLNKSLAIRMMVFGPESIDVATSFNNIGNVYSKKGDYDRAMENHNKSLAIRMMVFGPESIDVATSFNNIGNVYSKKGDYDRALANLNKSLAIRMKVFGPESIDVATSLNNIGNVYSKKGDYDRALENLNKSLAIRMKVFGPESIDVATSFNNIGNLYADKGDYDRAMENHNKSLAIRMMVFGPESIDVATSLNNIGNVYSKKGDYDRALENLNKSLAIRMKVFGPELIDVATSFNNIGNLYADKGDYDCALKNHNKFLSIQTNVLGLDE